MDEEKREEPMNETHHVSHHESSSVSESSPRKESMTSKMRENPWIASTLVLGILSLILIVANFSGGLTGNVVSAQDAGEMLLTYYEGNGATGLTLDSVDEVSGLYKVTFEYQGSKVPIYMTKDGSFAGSMSALSASASSSGSTTTDIPKTEKPAVELYVWSYCPYGVQAQGPMAEVANLLGSDAQFTIVPYYDGHGEYETQQNKIQSCIQKNYPDKYWDYAGRFVDEIYPVVSKTRDVEDDKAESIKLMNSLGIDSDAVMSCVESEGDALFEAASGKAQERGVSGSPTIVINGVKANVPRNAEGIKGAVCEAFSDAPEACETVLDSSAAAAAGNC